MIAKNVVKGSLGNIAHFLLSGMTSKFDQPFKRYLRSIFDVGVVD
jgi:hypothetical protein